MDVIKFLNFAKENWNSPFALVAGYVLILFASQLLSSIYKVPLLYNSVASASTCFFFTVYWIISNKLPRTKKDKTGITIAINSENKELHNVIFNDFVKSLKKIVDGNSFHTKFQLIELPLHMSKKIDNLDDARKIIKKTKCKLIIWGDAKRRLVKNQEHLVMRLDSLIVHPPITNQKSKLFQNELLNMFPCNLEIDSGNELIELESLSKYINMVVHFAIGTTAIISRDYDYSISILETLYSNVTNSLIHQKWSQKIYSVLPNRIKDAYISKAITTYEEHSNNLNTETISIIGECVNKAKTYCPSDAVVIIVSGIYNFLIGNTEGAIHDYKNCPESKDGLSHLNLAFLYAYKGYLSKAIGEYNKGFKLDYTGEILFQIEDFMLREYAKNSEKTQLLFCLGYINYYGKKDYKSAEDYFSRFLNSQRKSRYSKQYLQAKRCIQKICEDN